jgi:hypothetical protein
MDDHNENTERRGTIMSVSASWGSGLMALSIKKGDGKIEIVRGDNGPTVRALMNVFGSDIVRGHSLQVDRIVGQEIGYDTDDLGLLAYITE